MAGGDRSATDEELLRLLDEPCPWLVHAGLQQVALQGTLRKALQLARDLSAAGMAFTYISSLPDESVVIGAVQVLRLLIGTGMAGQ